MAVDRYPQNVKIGAKVWTLYWTQEEWDEMALREGPPAFRQLGFSQSSRNGIWIHPDQCKTEMQDTLLHEVLHAIWAQGPQPTVYRDLDNPEEALVARQTPWLLMVLRENPVLMAYLCSE